MQLTRLLAAAVVGGVATSTLAQNAPNLGQQQRANQAQQSIDRFQRQLDEFRITSRVRVNEDIPAGTRAFVDYGVFSSFSYLSLDDANLDNRAFRQAEFIAFARYNLDGVHEFFGRGRGFYRDFNDGDEFEEGDGDGWDGHLDRLYYKFDLGRYLSAKSGVVDKGNVTVKIGRDLVYWGTGLTMAQDLDALTLELTYDAVTLQLIAGRTPSDTVDIDSSRPDFDDHTKRAFYGGMLQGRVGAHRPYGFVLVQRDHNSDTFNTTLNGQDVTTNYDYNTWYAAVGSTGALGDRIAYGVEAVYQGGTTLSSPFVFNENGSTSAVDQTKDDIEAFAFNMQLDYLVGDTRNTRFSGEFIYATGDDDRIASNSNTFAGNSPGTTDGGFNAFGLLNTGTAFSPSVSNLIAIRGGASMFPFPESKFFRRMQVGVELFGFFKAESDAPSDEPTSDDRYLGFEPDLFINWQITSDVSFAFRYGYFFPGSAITADEKDRQFLFAGLTFAF